MHDHFALRVGKSTITAEALPLGKSSLNCQDRYTGASPYPNPGIFDDENLVTSQGNSRANASGAE